jgi:uncharacterized phosphosugar-binding protein
MISSNSGRNAMDVACIKKQCKYGIASIVVGSFKTSYKARMPVYKCVNNNAVSDKAYAGD